jgi:hypothetical protein
VWFALLLWSSFPIFLVVLVRVFLLSVLSSPVGDIFRCGEFFRSVLLLLLCIQVALRDSVPIVMCFCGCLIVLGSFSVSSTYGQQIAVSSANSLTLPCNGWEPIRGRNEPHSTLTQTVWRRFVK